jgi:hypothetical protein
MKFGVNIETFLKARPFLCVGEKSVQLLNGLAYKNNEENLGLKKF